jgi:hypothetical protein
VRSIASLKRQLVEMTGDLEFLDAVLLRAGMLLASRSSIPCAKQVRKANAFLCHAIRCVRKSNASVGLLSRPFTSEYTLTKGMVFDVGVVLRARPRLLEDGSFATLIAQRNVLGHEIVRLVRFKGRVHPYEETVLRYPEWCGQERRPTT